MSTSRISNELSLLAANILIAIKHKNDDASIYMGQLLRHFSVQDSLQELRLLIKQTENKELLLKSVDPEFKFNLLLEACQRGYLSVVEFLLEDGYIQKLSSYQFIKLLSHSIQNNFHKDFLYSILTARQKMNAKELSSLLTQNLSVLSNKKTDAILCEFGADPFTLMTKVKCNSSSIKIFMNYLDQYTYAEKIVALNVMINNKKYIDADMLLSKNPGIVKKIKTR